MYQPIDAVETSAALLSRGRPKVNFGAFCAELNTALDLREDMHLSLSPNSGKDFALLTSPSFHVLVTLSPRRYPRRAMAAALASTITRQKVFDYEAAITAHKGHIRVQIGSGPEFLGDGIAEMMAAAGNAPNVEEMPVGFRAAVLRVAVELLADKRVTAVHWSQSDMLLDPTELGPIAGSDVPALQAIHPLPLAGREKSGAQGIIAAHSEHFVGRTVQVDPWDRPLAASISMALSMVVEKEAGRLALEHGDAVQTGGGQTLYVRHEAPDRSWPAGRICLGETPPKGPAPVAPQVAAAPMEEPERMAAPLSDPGFAGGVDALPGTQIPKTAVSAQRMSGGAALAEGLRSVIPGGNSGVMVMLAGGAMLFLYMQAGSLVGDGISTGLSGIAIAEGAIVPAGWEDGTTASGNQVTVVSRGEPAAPQTAALAGTPEPTATAAAPEPDLEPEPEQAPSRISTRLPQVTD